MSSEKIRRLVVSRGKVRVVEMDDGSIAERQGGSVSWRNNNPGNLKLEFVGSADKTVNTRRTRERAVKDAKTFYKGVVDLDQWGNVIFENYEAGRAAKIQLLEKKHHSKTVEEMLLSYSTADYTGSTHHRAQADFIYRQADRSGIDLRSKTIGQMNALELAALADGIKGFEGWKVGETRQLAAGDHALQTTVDKSTAGASPSQMAAKSPREYPPGIASAKSPPRVEPRRSGGAHQGPHGERTTQLQESLRDLGYHGAQGHPLMADGHFGQNTRHAVESFQHAHHLHVDGIAGKHTLAALEQARTSPLLTEATHPQHALYLGVLRGVESLPSQAFAGSEQQRNAAASLTAMAHAGGIRRVDHVVLGSNGVNLFAVQGGLDDPGHRRVCVDRLLASSQTVVQSSEVLKRDHVPDRALHADLAQQRHAAMGAVRQEDVGFGF